MVKLSPEETLAPRWSPTKVVLFSASLQLVWMTHEQWDRGCRGVVRQAMTLCRSFYLMCFEGFQKAIDHPL